VLNTLDASAWWLTITAKFQRPVSADESLDRPINAEATKSGVFEARTSWNVFKPLLNERASRVFRLQEMCEGRQDAEVTKHRILRKLLARMEERPVPNAVIELLNGGWRNVLLMAEMRHGVDSDEASEAWQVLQQLCAWLDPNRLTPATADIQASPASTNRSPCVRDKLRRTASSTNRYGTLRRRQTQHQHLRRHSTQRAASEPLSEIRTTWLSACAWSGSTLESPLNLSGLAIATSTCLPTIAASNSISSVGFIAVAGNGDAEWTEDMELR
jgi:hypothetical protein